MMKNGKFSHSFQRLKRVRSRRTQHNLDMLCDIKQESLNVNNNSDNDCGQFPIRKTTSIFVPSVKFKKNPGKCTFNDVRPRVTLVHVLRWYYYCGGVLFLICFY